MRHVLRALAVGAVLVSGVALSACGSDGPATGTDSGPGAATAPAAATVDISAYSIARESGCTDLYGEGAGPWRVGLNGTTVGCYHSEKLARGAAEYDARTADEPLVSELVDPRPLLSESMAVVEAAAAEVGGYDKIGAADLQRHDHLAGEHKIIYAIEQPDERTGSQRGGDLPGHFTVVWFRYTRPYGLTDADSTGYQLTVYQPREGPSGVAWDGESRTGAAPQRDPAIWVRSDMSPYTELYAPNVADAFDFDCREDQWVLELGTDDPDAARCFDDEQSAVAVRERYLADNPGPHVLRHCDAAVYEDLIERFCAEPQDEPTGTDPSDGGWTWEPRSG